MKSLVPIALGLFVACSKGPPSRDSGVVSCATHVSPSFELGTGNDFWMGALADGQELQMQRGSQGGCHLPLAFRTDGFAEWRFKIFYRLSIADTGREIIDSVETRNLLPRKDAPGKCEVLSVRAFLIEPWNVENERVRMEIRVVDDLGAEASTELIVHALWPDDVEGVLRENLCGRRMMPDAGAID